MSHESISVGKQLLFFVNDSFLIIFARLFTGNNGEFDML